MKIITPIVLIFLLSCKSERSSEKLTGDLYFSLLRIGSYYNQPDSMVFGLERYMDTINLETADNDQKKIIHQFKRLKDEGLLYLPFVQIKDARDSVLTLYLEKNDYDQIKLYKRRELQQEGKRIRIEANVRRIDDALFYCSKLLAVEKIDGDTWIKSKKWKVDDYD
jgi:hypothetical protein